MRPVDTIERSIVPVSFSSETERLAIVASELLGYHRLYFEVGASSLARVLAELEIPVLDYQSVKQYQLEARTELSKKLPRGETAKWESTQLEKYTRPIPEFVLNKAVEIKRKLPQVFFLVEELEKFKDPFLVAQTGKKVRHKGFLGDDYEAVEALESYYIEVWDEPKFEGRITK